MDGSHSELATSINDIAEILEKTKKVKSLAKVAGAAGLLSVGFDVAMAFTAPQKSELEILAELVLGEIAKLSDKVDQLYNAIVVRFRKSDRLQNWNLAKNQLDEHLRDARELSRVLQRYHIAIQTKNTESIRVESKSLLEDFRIAALENILDAIHRAAVGGLTSENILKANYELKNGHVHDLVRIGLLLTQTFKMVLSAMGVYYRVEYANAHGGAELPLSQRRVHETEVQAQWGSKLNEVVSAMDFWVREAKRDHHNLIAMKIDDLVTEIDVTVEDISIGEGGQAAAETIGKALKEQYFWLGFGTAVWKPVGEWNRIGHTGYWTVHLREGTKWRNNFEADLLVYYRNPDVHAHGIPYDRMASMMELFINLWGGLGFQPDQYAITGTKVENPDTPQWYRDKNPWGFVKEIVQPEWAFSDYGFFLMVNSPWWGLWNSPEMIRYNDWRRDFRIVGFS